MFNSRKVVFPIGVLVIATLIVGIAYAHGNDGEIHACVNPEQQIRIVDSPEDCRGEETNLDWNIEGLQGPPGENGLDGEDGEDGQNGEDGEDGQNGEDGDTGDPGPQGEQGDPGLPGTLDFYTRSVAVVVPAPTVPGTGMLATGDVSCYTGDLATGGGWVGQIGAAEFNVTRDTPVFGTAGKSVGWSVTFNNTSSVVGGGVVYVICADVTE